MRRTTAGDAGCPALRVSGPNNEVVNICEWEGDSPPIYLVLLFWCSHTALLVCVIPLPSFDLNAIDLLID